MLLPLCFNLLFSPPEPEQMKEKQHYLKSVEKFCSLARNDWHRVYLVRKIASQHGMEFAQKLVTEPQFSWVFPAEILQQVEKRQLLVMVVARGQWPQARGAGAGRCLVLALC